MENGKATQLTNDKTYDSWWTRISPNRKQFVFYRSLVKKRPKIGGADGNYGNAALWIMSSDGSNQRELIPHRGYGSTRQGVASWSPDGKRLIMAMSMAKDNRWNLYVTDNEGRNPVKVSRRDSLYLDPSFSPDGKQILYCAFPEGYQGFDLSKLEVFIADADGSNEKRLTNDNLRDNDPAWSWDGREIAFETAVEPHYFFVGKWAIRAVKPSGTGLRTIINDGNINTAPRWTKDSTLIYFHRFVFSSKRKFIIARINADGNRLEQLTPGGDYDDTTVDVF